MRLPFPLALAGMLIGLAACDPNTVKLPNKGPVGTVPNQPADPCQNRDTLRPHEPCP